MRSTLQFYNCTNPALFEATEPLQVQHSYYKVDRWADSGETRRRSTVKELQVALNQCYVYTKNYLEDFYVEQQPH